MKISKKLLHPYEQSLLLVAMLFSRKYLDDILQLFPNEQVERIKHAKERFLSLEKNERITQIILELRRLLLTKENSTSLIHPSWINDELQKEPAYLRTLLNEELGARLSQGKHNFFPRSLLIQSFAPEFMKTPPKAALFDPALMRLQALKELSLSKAMVTIGALTMAYLGEYLHKTRFQAYIAKRFPHVPWEKIPSSSEKNPFYETSLRTIALKHLVHHCTKVDDMGLFCIAAYLHFHKVCWHRAIELALPKNIGLELRSILTHFSSLPPILETKPLFANMLIVAMDDTFT